MTVVAARSRWKRWSKLAVLATAAVAAVFITLNYHPASPARVAVVGRVMDIRPEVEGRVIAVAAEPNTLVRKGSALVQIDPAPYEMKLKQTEAELTAARRKIDGLKSELASAVAAVETLQTQDDDAARELDQLERRPGLGTGAEFRLFYIQDERALLATQLRMAKAEAVKARQAYDAQISAAHLSTARLAVQLAETRSQLDHATIRAPADGYVSRINVAVGARAVTTRAAVSFIAADEITDRERFLSGNTSTSSTPARAYRRGHKGHKTFASRIRALTR